MFTRQILHIYQMVRTDLQNVGCTYWREVCLWPTDEKIESMAELWRSITMVEQSTSQSQAAARRDGSPYLAAAGATHCLSANC